MQGSCTIPFWGRRRGERIGTLQTLPRARPWLELQSLSRYPVLLRVDKVLNSLPGTFHALERRKGKKGQQSSDRSASHAPVLFSVFLCLNVEVMLNVLRVCHTLPNLFGFQKKMPHLEAKLRLFWRAERRVFRSFFLVCVRGEGVNRFISAYLRPLAAYGNRTVRESQGFRVTNVHFAICGFRASKRATADDNSRSSRKQTTLFFPLTIIFKKKADERKKIWQQKLRAAGIYRAEY